MGTMWPETAILGNLLAEAARDELLPRFRSAQIGRKADGSVVTDADLAMQHRLQVELRARWPGHALLGEEMEPMEQRALLAETATGVWCVDPLDGTSNFAAGIPFFSVSLALLVAGEPVLGVIHDPIREETFSAVKDGGAQLNGQPLACDGPFPELSRCIAAVDFKRLDTALRAALVREPPYASQRNFGSCALEWGWLAASRIHVYLHGGQKLWDHAAGSLLLAEAGGHSRTLRGEPVFAAELDPRSVVASGSDKLEDQWYRWIVAHAR